MRKVLILLCLLVFACFAEAQSSYRTGFLPAVNLNKKFERDFSVNFKIESRQILESGDFGESNAFAYDYALTDFALIGAKKIAINRSLTLGYLLRLEDGKIINRSIQQFIATKSYPGFKLGQRVAADQTFAAEEETEFRFRYRLSSEFALNGLAVDVRELYIKVNNEYLNGWQGGDYDLEIRLVPLLGYKFPKDKKLEAGLDYRLSSFVSGSARHSFWFGLNWYQSI